MPNAEVLAGLARRLNREAGRPPIPALYFFTDPARTPDPVQAAARLPAGTAVVFRHFGAAERAATAEALARLCRARRLYLLIAADPDLAGAVNADGVHWPERLSPTRRRARGWLEIGAAHGRRGLRRAAVAGLDACVLGPVFPTRSASGNPPLGPWRAGRLAADAGLPVIALGGITQRTAKRLIGRGFSGLAGVEALTA